LATVRITPASSPDDLERARALVRAYFLSWGMQEVTDPELLDELATLGERYGPPDGALVVCMLEDEPAGVVALRRHDERSCVMKRLFVRPEFRRKGVARALATRLLAEAERLGYERMVLDTPTENGRALNLYRSLGFTEIEPYWDEPYPDMPWTFLAVQLRARLARAVRLDEE
jgi:ribosomal protein S18 acetylase RimI-like enzyme